MAKARISISLDPEQAERIRSAAEEGGQDVRLGCAKLPVAVYFREL